MRPYAAPVCTEIAFFVWVGSWEQKCVNFFSHKFDEFWHFSNGLFFIYLCKHLKLNQIVEKLEFGKPFAFL